MGRYLHLQGKVYYAVRNAVTGLPGPRRYLGNARSCSIETETNIIEHLESTSGLRIMDNRYQFGLKVNATLEFDEYDKRNLALAVKGNFLDIASGNVGAGNETLPAGITAGTYYRTRFGNISNLAIGNLVSDTHYVLEDAKAGRIRFLQDVDGTPDVTYNYAAQTRIPALNDTAPPELWLEIDGINVAAQSKRVNVTIYRFAFNATENLMLLNDDPTMFTLRGAVLRDPNYSTGTNYTNFGEYFNILEVE
jgi:hypothetical protein